MSILTRKKSHSHPAHVNSKPGGRCSEEKFHHLAVTTMTLTRPCPGLFYPFVQILPRRLRRHVFSAHLLFLARNLSRPDAAPVGVRGTREKICPVLVQPVQIDRVAAMAKHLPDSKLTVLPGGNARLRPLLTSMSVVFFYQQAANSSCQLVTAYAVLVPLSTLRKEL
jgi:hypothetical protein